MPEAETPQEAGGWLELPRNRNFKGYNGTDKGKEKENDL